jgi:hypothetical protein
MNKMQTKNLLLLLPLLVILLSCKFNREIENNKIEKSETVNFVDSLKDINIIKLPVKYYCGIEGKDLQMNFPTSMINIVPSLSGIVGRLPISNDKIYLIYGQQSDIIVPILYIYSSKGEKLDSLYLMINGCVSDEYGSIINSVIINADYSIDMIDTTQYIHYENSLLIIDSTRITTKNMQLDSNGLYR